MPRDPDQDQPNLERLHKVLARAGVASRRKSEELISQGRVTVNGKVVTELGFKVDPARDLLRVDGRRVQAAENPVYILLNKPKGILSTMEDARGRAALSSLVTVSERLYPVGRLDLNSEGLILLTNDGELANLLTHPRHQHDKEYLVSVNGVPSEGALDSWRKGLSLEGEQTAPAQVSVVRQEKNGTLLRVVMHEGRKRQIRRIAALLGHPVRGLRRVRLGPLHLGSLPSGQWRHLTADEVRRLQALKRRRLSKSSRGPRRPRARR